MLRRRDFLRATVITAGTLLVPGCDNAIELSPLPVPGRTLADGTTYFPQSVASGDPRPDSVILWARVTDADHLTEDLALEVEVSTDATFATVLSLGSGQATVKKYCCL